MLLTQGQQKFYLSLPDVGKFVEAMLFTAWPVACQLANVCLIDSRRHRLQRLLKLCGALADMPGSMLLLVAGLGQQ